MPCVWRIDLFPHASRSRLRSTRRTISWFVRGSATHHCKCTTENLLLTLALRLLRLLHRRQQLLRRRHRGAARSHDSLEVVSRRVIVPQRQGRPCPPTQRLVVALNSLVSRRGDAPALGGGAPAPNAGLRWREREPTRAPTHAAPRLARTTEANLWRQLKPPLTRRFHRLHRRRTLVLSAHMATLFSRSACVATSPGTGSAQATSWCWSRTCRPAW